MSKINYYSSDMKYADSEEIFKKTSSYIFRKMAEINPILKINPVTNKKMQFEGVDKILTTRKNVFLKLEEKVRKKDWGDILIEIVADDRYASYCPHTNQFNYSEMRGVGWGMKQYKTDLLLYYFEESDSGYLLSWKKFQEMFLNNIQSWYLLALANKDKFAIKNAQNKNYSSINIAIPKKEFEKAYIKVGGKII